MEPSKPWLKVPITLLRIFGWLLIIVGILYFITVPFSRYSYSVLTIVIAVAILVEGILYMILAEGLHNGKKWAWYVGVVIFGLNVLGGLFNRSMAGILLLIINAVFLFILVINKKAFFEASGEPPKA